MSDTPRTDALQIPSEVLLLLGEKGVPEQIVKAILAIGAHASQMEREADDLREALEDRRKIDSRVHLIRQAIFNVLDTGDLLPNWDFYAADEDRANAQRVDFADRVVTWLAQSDKESRK